jgi:predicted membrane protein
MSVGRHLRWSDFGGQKKRNKEIGGFILFYGFYGVFSSKKSLYVVRSSTLVVLFFFVFLPWFVLLPFCFVLSFPFVTDSALPLGNYVLS